MLTNDLRFLRTLRRDLVEKRRKRFFNELLLSKCAVNERDRWGRSGLWRDSQIEVDRRLPYAQLTVRCGMNDEETAVQFVTPSVLNRGGEDVEMIRNRSVKVVEDRAALK